MRAAIGAICLSLGLMSDAVLATSIIPPPDPRALAIAQDMVGSFPIGNSLRRDPRDDWDGIAKRLDDDVSDCLWVGLPSPPLASIRPMFDAKVATAIGLRMAEGENAVREAVVLQYARDIPLQQLEQISAFMKTAAGQNLVKDLARRGELFSVTASREFCRLLWADKSRLLAEAEDSERIRTTVNRPR